LSGGDPQIILRMLDRVMQEYQCSDRKKSDDSWGRLKINVPGEKREKESQDRGNRRAS
jgi:hypothetical protein